MGNQQGIGSPRGSWARREDGQAAVEYGILAAAIAAVCAAVVQVLGTDVVGLFSSALGAF